MLSTPEPTVATRAVPVDRHRPAGRTRWFVALGTVTALAVTAAPTGAVAAPVLGPTGRVLAAQRADPGAECPPGQSDCHVWDEEPGTPGSPGNPGGGGGGSGRTCQRNGVTVPCYDDLLGWFNNSDGCYYKRARPQPPGGPAGQTLYLRSCAGAQEPVWLTNPPDGYGTPPDPAELANRALASLTLRRPTVGIAPNRGPGLVGLPIWLWTDPGPTTWGPQRASARAPGLTVNIRARVTKIVWNMGNGRRITCTNPGVEYVPGRDGGGPSPKCGYAGYPRSSHGRPGGTYRITATTTWRVDWWTGGGRRGVLPLQTRTSEPRQLRIDELQVVTG